jgi:ATP-binding cassette subfamily C protein CydC
MRDFWRLAHFALAFKWWMVVAVLLGAGTVGASIGLMATSAYLISAAALHPSIAALNVAIVGVRFFGIARGVLRYLERLTSHTVSLRLLTALRVWFYNALEPLAPARLQQYHSGDVLTRAVTDIDTLQDFYVRVLAPPLVAVVIALGMGAFLWLFDARLAMVLWLAWLIAGVGIPAAVQRATRNIARAWVAARADMHAQMVDAIQGIADLTAFGQCATIHTRANATSQRYASAQMRMARINALQAGASDWLANLTLFLVLGIGVAAVNAQEFSGVYLATLALATAAAFEAVTPLPQAAQALENSLAAGQRLFEFTAPPPTKTAPRYALPASPKAQPRGTTLLELRHARFAYANGEPNALDDISFTLARGEKIAIVGPSGAGKSTLVNILARFWDLDAGEIFLRGAPLRELAPENARAQISVIAQRTYLFNASARENLRLAKPDATQDEIERAAQRAQIHAFLQQLPQGYDTPIGERGAALSGGERQRLGVARALLRDTPLWMLDEPTAQLDAANERALLHEIFDACADRGLILLTHRLADLARMDTILVLDRGRIVERGTHDELLKQCGLYARMWTLQHQTMAYAPHLDLDQHKEATMLSGEQLQAYPFFARLNAAQLRVIAALTREQHLEPNVTLFQEGDAADTLYLPLQGSVDLYFGMEGHPKQRVLAGEIEAGIPVGISALIEPHTYMMTARTATPCRMLEMNGALLRAIFEVDPTMGYTFMREIAKASLERLHLARVQLARETEPDLVI